MKALHPSATSYLPVYTALRPRRLEFSQFKQFTHWATDSKLHLYLYLAIDL